MWFYFADPGNTGTSRKTICSVRIFNRKRLHTSGIDLIDKMSLPPNTRKPEDLTEFTFGHYNALICNKYNRHVFEPAFDKIKELVDNDFKEIADLRTLSFTPNAE